MKTMIEYFKGKKTYVVVLVAVGYAAGVYFGAWEADAEIVAGLAALSLAAVRSAISDLKASIEKPQP